MLSKYFSSQRTEIGLLFFSTVFCLSLLVFRLVYTESMFLIFLCWNLFLAAIPWLIASVLTHFQQFHNQKYIFIIMLFAWMLFFPNAPYILTDLFHLNKGGLMPQWFDLILILSFAWTGLIFGFFSLMRLEKTAQNLMPPFWVKTTIAILLFLSSFGIYLGRFLRWNSWDIISDPLGLMIAIGERIIFPFAHSRTWGVTLLLGILLNMIYWSMRIINTNERK